MALENPSDPSRPHGEAKLIVYLDGESDQMELYCSSSWWTADGELREAGLSLTGELTEAYDLINEASRWIWSRWKRPISSHGPFG